MLRKNIVQKYLPNHSIDTIIAHDRSVFIRILFWHFLFLGITYGLFILTYSLWETSLLSRAAAGIGIILFSKFLIDFLNLYLDGIVLTDNGVAVFRREGLVQYKMELFERPKVEMISFEQTSIRDRLFQKGDIMITLDYSVTFSFDNIPYPKKQVSTIMTTKYKYTKEQDNNDEESEYDDKEKFDLLVETLGEVIKDYMGKDGEPIKKRPPHEQHDRYSERPIGFGSYNTLDSHSDDE